MVDGREPAEPHSGAGSHVSFPHLPTCPPITTPRLPPSGTGSGGKRQGQASGAGVEGRLPVADIPVVSPCHSRPPLSFPPPFVIPASLRLSFPQVLSGNPASFPFSHKDREWSTPRPGPMPGCPPQYPGFPLKTGGNDRTSCRRCQVDSHPPSGIPTIVPPDHPPTTAIRGGWRHWKRSLGGPVVHSYVAAGQRPVHPEAGIGLPGEAARRPSDIDKFVPLDLDGDAFADAVGVAALGGADEFDRAHGGRRRCRRDGGHGDGECCQCAGEQDTREAPILKPHHELDTQAEPSTPEWMDFGRTFCGTVDYSIFSTRQNSLPSANRARRRSPTWTDCASVTILSPGLV